MWSPRSMTIRAENRLKEGYHFQKTRRLYDFSADDSFPRRFPPLTIGMLSAALPDWRLPANP
jgi:hypothetical protein